MQGILGSRPNLRIYNLHLGTTKAYIIHARSGIEKRGEFRRMDEVLMLARSRIRRTVAPPRQNLVGQMAARGRAG